MLSALSSALSGLNDAALRVSTLTKRVANAATVDFHPATGATTPDSSDLTGALLDAKLAETSYKANATVIRAVLSTKEKLLDMLA